MTEPAQGKLRIDDFGIGTVLKRRLIVPPNQREYSWTEKQVTDLFDDLKRAISENQSVYFLGTIALTGGHPGTPEVTDGQQRLATTMILLAAFRDYFHEHKDDFKCNWLDSDFLVISDPDEGKVVPRLTLNVDDRDCFSSFIATKPGDKRRLTTFKKRSNELIKNAVQLAQQHVQSIASYKKDADNFKQLRKWIDFIEERAIVIVLQLPSDLNAFQMFETLNDRGLKTTQLDIIKNYLFREVGQAKMIEAQPLWSRMTGVLDSVEIDDVALVFLRHFIITKIGPARERELYQKVEEIVPNKYRPLDFIKEMDDSAADYVAIISHDHRKWNSYPQGIRNSIRTLKDLRIVLIRPLMLAVARMFEAKEAEKAFRAFVSWSVRFLITGGGRGSAVEDAYSKAAADISAGKIKTLQDLEFAVVPVVPSDQDFRTAFSVAKVFKNYLARYYLRSIEMKLKGSNEPEWIPNEDTVINLEHVLPENPDPHWPHMTPDEAESYYPRLGNMVLLQASKNSTIGNCPFEDKREVLKSSTYILTAEVGKRKKWDGNEIERRQELLAQHAVETWPVPR